VLPYGKYFDDERRLAGVTAYHGMVSFLDHNIGVLMNALADAGLDGETRIVYSSDHGEMLGRHGIWGKCCMYEDSVGIPLIMAGADIPQGGINGTEVSLVDCFPTILDAVGAGPPAESGSLPGRSLLRMGVETDESRVGFSEYHAVGAPSGCFMVRQGRWKMVYYVGMEPQLFDLVADPREVDDLAARPEFATVRANLETKLRAIVDPEAASAQAFADQKAKIETFGGEQAVLDIGDFGHTPTPGETPRFAAHAGSGAGSH
jgi:choline-sulfatase